MRERRKRYASSQHPYTQIISLWGNKQQTKHHHRRRRVFIRRKNQTRERERETPAKNDDQNASSLLLSERGMDVPCETLSQTRSFANSTAEVGVFSPLFFLCFIFRVSKKKEKKKKRGKRKGIVSQSSSRFCSLPPLPPLPTKSAHHHHHHHHHHHSFCSRRRRMIPNALHKPFYTVRCSFVLSLCLSSTVAIFKSIQTAFVL